MKTVFVMAVAETKAQFMWSVVGSLLEKSRICDCLPVFS